MTQENGRAYYSKDCYRKHGKAPSGAMKEKERQRLEKTLALIPPGVKTVLEIGCGDGRLANLLSQRYYVLGVDFVTDGLYRLDCPAAAMDISALALKNASFELVVLAEVLEHLPGALWKTALREVERAAAKYILVTVPYRENLASGLIRCFDCGTVFHAWRHLRSFNGREDITRLFPSLLPLKYELFGPPRGCRSDFLIFLKQKIGRRWYRGGEGVVCPRCGNRDFPDKRDNTLGRACGALEGALSRIAPRGKPRWAAVLFGRTAE